MAQQVCVVLSIAEREQLAAIAADRNQPRKHVERARMCSPRRIVTRRSGWRKASARGISFRELDRFILPFNVLGKLPAGHGA
jgi:hypothetical protein